MEKRVNPGCLRVLANYKPNSELHVHIAILLWYTSTSAGQRQAVERDCDPVEPERAQQVQGQADRRSQGKYTIHSASVSDPDPGYF